MKTLCREIATHVYVLTGVLMLMLFSADSLTADPPRFRTEEGEETLKVSFGDRPLLEYRSARDALKPYVRQFYTPSAVRVLRDAPSDHKHHHALMLAMGINEVDFWHEQAGEEGAVVVGRQRPRGLVSTSAAGVDARQRLSIRQQIDWIDKNERPLLVEARTIIVHGQDSSDASLVTWTSRLVPAQGHPSIELNGAHYFGLGMRFVESMDKVGKFINAADSDGESIRGSEKLVRAAWCAYTAPIDGHDVTVAMFSLPANPRQPTAWFTMTDPFAYMAATLELHRRPLRLSAGETLELTYGIVLWDGRIDRDRIEQAYGTWLDRQR